MTPKELISTLKQLHEAAAGGDPEKCENLELAVSSELPRIIRLLEAGEKVAKMLRLSRQNIQLLKIGERDNGLVDALGEWDGELSAALSAYEGAGK